MTRTVMTCRLAHSCRRAATTAFKAVLAGYRLIALRNVDAAVHWVPEATAPATYRVGIGFGEVKAKFVQPGETRSLMEACPPTGLRPGRGQFSPPRHGPACRRPYG
ncbi:hypothetical protein ABZX77_15490, partial [Streptomyces sp. NPDC004237]|uniref:hypothetical protein n=1 Tax=Streptomyces sp. NPDC004237 TaxID=3154455 RepID=UPI0033A7DB7C